MDFDFTEDQEQLRDAVRKWVDKAYTFERRRTIAKDGGFSADAYQELADLGLCGMYVPEDLGGLGMGPVEGMVVMEELGRGIVLEPLAQALIAGAVLGHYAPKPLATEWAGAVASGESLVSLAYQERAARYRLDNCTTQASGKDGAWTLSGAKSLVVAGDRADAYLVSAMRDGTLAMFLVERNAPGVKLHAYGVLDGGRAAELMLDAAPAQLVSRDGLAVLAHAVDIGIAATCAQAVGVMDKTLAITIEYMNTRKRVAGGAARRPARRLRPGVAAAHGCRPVNPAPPPPEPPCGPRWRAPSSSWVSRCDSLASKQYSCMAALA